MVRRLTGYAVVALIGIMAVKVVFAVVGMVFSLLWMLFWFATLAFVLYLILRLVNPAAARKVRDTVSGDGEPSESTAD